MNYFSSDAKYESTVLKCVGVEVEVLSSRKYKYSSNVQ